jgi:hypothetical protein
MLLIVSSILPLHQQNPVIFLWHLNSKAGKGFSLNREFAVVSTTLEVSTSRAEIVYVSSTGNLYANLNGQDLGYGGGGQFTTLTTKPALRASDFIIQS